jgi:hypothetical protein
MINYKATPYSNKVCDLFTQTSVDIWLVFIGKCKINSSPFNFAANRIQKHRHGMGPPTHNVTNVSMNK